MMNDWNFQTIPIGIVRLKHQVFQKFLELKNKIRKRWLPNNVENVVIRFLLFLVNKKYATDFIIAATIEKIKSENLTFSCG